MSDRPQILVMEDAAAVAEEGARRFAAASGELVNIALAGGSTPKAANHLLSGEHAHEVEWSRIALWFGDERCVAPDDAQSNFRMVTESLLTPLAAQGLRPARVERLMGELDPDEAARLYSDKIANVALDIVFLGMGPDGHTASLFPGAPELKKRGVALATEQPHLGVRRLTLSYDKINSAREIVVLATGAEKAESLKLAVDGAPHIVPLRDVRPTAGRMIIVCDKAAAARL